MAKDDCFVPCDTETLMDNSGEIKAGKDGVPVKLNLKKVLRKRISISSVV